MSSDPQQPKPKRKYKPRSAVYDPCTVRPYNRYNIFFILERELAVQSNSDCRPSFEGLPDFVTGFEGLDIPDELPPCYAHLELSSGWYLPARNTSRKHNKSHGVMTFSELSRSIAKAYKKVDQKTFRYIDVVSKAMIKRSHEIKKAGGIAGQTARTYSSNKSISKVPKASRRISVEARTNEVQDYNQNELDSTIVSQLDETTHVDEQTEIEPEDIPSLASALVPIVPISDEGGSKSGSGRLRVPCGRYLPAVVPSGSLEPVASRSLEEAVMTNEEPQESLTQVDISDHDILRMWLVS